MIDSRVNTSQLLLAVVCLAAAVASSDAQPASPWTVTIEGGWHQASPSETAEPDFPAGTPFTTVTGLPGRRASSWYFGDGAKLLNDALAQLSVPAGSYVQPLDSAAGGALADVSDGFDIGIRVSRSLTPRFAIEGAFEMSTAPARTADATRDAIDASRASFVTAINALLATGPFNNPQIASTANVTSGSVRQALTSGSVVVALTTGGEWIPYVTAGAGVLSSFGTAPSAALEGSYSFVIAGTSAPIAERDTVTITTRMPTVAAGLVGAGVKWQRSGWGVRVEARARLSQDRRETTIEATPATTAGTPADAIASYTTPSLQFSNTPAVPSTLGGDGLRTTSTLSSFQVVPRVSAGFFLRF